MGADHGAWEAQAFRSLQLTTFPRAPRAEPPACNKGDEVLCCMPGLRGQLAAAPCGNLKEVVYQMSDASATMQQLARRMAPPCHASPLKEARLESPAKQRLG